MSAKRCPECGGVKGHKLNCTVLHAEAGVAQKPDGGFANVLNTDVDGEPASVIRGNGEQLIEASVTDTDVLRELAEAQEVMAAAHTVARKAANAYTATVKAWKRAAESAAQHYADSRQLTMQLTEGGTAPDDETEDESE
jgi:uncharacterized protein YukE